MSSEKKELNPDCPCKYVDCPRHGDCEACKRNHHAAGQKTSCEREQQ
jgi:hypothetical protein